ncbi:MAG: DUF4192 family protein [Motilibacteraceae bacterium]
MTSLPSLPSLPDPIEPTQPTQPVEPAAASPAVDRPVAPRPPSEDPTAPWLHLAEFVRPEPAPAPSPAPVGSAPARRHPRREDRRRGRRGRGQERGNRPGPVRAAGRADARPETVVRLSGPASLVAAVPHLVGFEPVESVVVVAMRETAEGRTRIVLTERVDLPGLLSDDPDDELLAQAGLDQEEALDLGVELADLLAVRAAQAGASSAVVIVWSGSARPGSPLPFRRLVDQLGDALADLEAPMLDALAVGPDAWWSYVCQDTGCCPPEGTARASLDSGPFAAASALAGRSLLPDRAALVRSVARVEGEELERQQELRDRVRAELEARVEAVGNASFLRWQTLDLWEEWLLALPQRRVVPDEVVARLSIGLEDLVTRDAVVCRVLTDEPEVVDDAIALLLAVVPRALPSEDSACTTLLGWFAYAQGDGALANVCLDRVQESDPAYSMAALLREGIERGAEPHLLREAARDSAPLVHQLLAG